MTLKFKKTKITTFLFTVLLTTIMTASTVFASNVVVVLDPGHDSRHAGAQYDSFGEEDLNLQVALYCKEVLEQYEGITIYMTRDEEGCPYPGTSAGDDNVKRVEYAKSVNADAYVSFHFNSAANPSAKGVMVYHPNMNYKPEVGKNGKVLAQGIQDEIVKLGLNDRGITVRNSEDGTKYPDGTIADYYAIIKNCKYRDIPCIIIEHAFLTSPSDRAFLSVPNNMTRLGMADAAGIVAYFNLKLKQPDPTPTPTPDPIPTPTATPTPTPSLPVGAFYFGDVDQNNTVDATDALMVLRHVVKLSYIDDEISLHLSDTDHNEVIEAADALKILRVTVKLEQAEIWQP